MHTQAIRAYHGTASDFDRFRTPGEKPGAEPNSMLGISLTFSPGDAAEYARMAARDPGAGTPRVLVVDVEIKGAVGWIHHQEHFLGLDPENPCREEDPEELMAAIREELLAEGCVAVLSCGGMFDDLLNDALLVLSPEHCSIVGTLSISEAETLGEDYYEKLGGDEPQPWENLPSEIEVERRFFAPRFDFGIMPLSA